MCGQRVTEKSVNIVPEAHVWNVKDGNCCAYCGAANACDHVGATKVESSGCLNDYVDNHIGTHSVTVETSTYWFCDACYATWGYETTAKRQAFPHAWTEIAPGPIEFLCEACGSINPYECAHPNGKKTKVLEYYEYHSENPEGIDDPKPMDNGDDLTAAVEDYEIMILQGHIAEPHQFKPDSRYCYIRDNMDGLVSYNGQIFYIDGYLATGFVGILKDVNRTEFNIIYD